MKWTSIWLVVHMSYFVLFHEPFWTYHDARYTRRLTWSLSVCMEYVAPFYVTFSISLLYSIMFLIFLSNVFIFGAVSYSICAITWWRHQMETFSALLALCMRKPTGHRWIPPIKTSDAELWCFLWSASDETVEQTIETPMIWDTIALIMTSL